MKPVRLDVAAVALGVSVRTLLRYVADGAPHQRHGRAIYMDPDALLQWRACRAVARRLT